MRPEYSEHMIRLNAAVTLAHALALTALVEAPLRADGQDPAGQSSSGAHAPQPFYVQAGALGIAQPAGVANHRIDPPVSGGAFGVTASAGAFLTPAFAIEGEFVTQRAVSTRQHFSYSWAEDYTSQNSDRFISGYARWRWGGEAGHVELIGGGGLAVSSFAVRSNVRTDFFPAGVTPLPDQVTKYKAPTLGGGIAFPLRVHPNLSIVPGFRGQWVKQPDDSSAVYRGVGRYLYQFGAAVRFGGY
jgi:hypothetical protein